MKPNRPLNILTQTVNSLREGIRLGRWAGTLPGVRPLARELAVSPSTIQAALKRLRIEGLVDAAEPGVRRRIPVNPKNAKRRERALRVGLLPFDLHVGRVTTAPSLLYDLSHELEAAGHRPFMARKSLQGMRHNSTAIREMMTDSEADAWIIETPQRDLLESLESGFPIPFLSIGGRVSGLKIASVGVHSIPSLREAVRRLAALGHRRIVAVLPARYHRPTAGPTVRAVTEELAAAGIRPGPYNTPEWDGTPEDFYRLMDTLFRLTPPTALLLDDPRCAVTTQSYLAQRQIAPQEISLVVVGRDPLLGWFRPVPAVIDYQPQALIDRITSWVDACAEGRSDRMGVLIESRLESDSGMRPPKT